MTADPPRHDPLPPGEEGDRQIMMHELRQHVRASADIPDPVHLLRVRLHDQPGAALYLLAAWSIVARLAADAARDRSGDELTDLGGGVFSAAELSDILGSDRISANMMMRLGVWRRGRWLAWYRSCSPVPLPRIAWP